MGVGLTIVEGNGLFGVSLGHPFVNNGDFVAYSCARAMRSNDFGRIVFDIKERAHVFYGHQKLTTSLKISCRSNYKASETDIQLDTQAVIRPADPRRQHTS